MDFLVLEFAGGQDIVKRDSPLVTQFIRISGTLALACPKFRLGILPVGLIHPIPNAYFDLRLPIRDCE